MSRLLSIVALVLGAGLLVFAWATRVDGLDAADLPEYAANVANGELVFWAGGCASCHATPVDGKRARGEDKLALGGGLELDTPYGVFRAPNISPHADDGIGAWSILDFVNSLKFGVSPEGRHYYPSFPYASYTRMPVEDLIDLKAYMDTLPAVAGRVEDHSLSFPWSFRRGIGAWKRLYLDDSPAVSLRSDDPIVERGQALVEGAGHCGECHTPRDRLGGLLRSSWLAGAPNPEGKGRIPNITPAGKNTSDWTAADIQYYLETGFTPDFDTVGGSMVAVQENMAKLPAEDLAAIAAYLKAVPAHD